MVDIIYAFPIAIGLFVFLTGIVLIHNMKHSRNMRRFTNLLEPIIYTLNDMRRKAEDHHNDLGAGLTQILKKLDEITQIIPTEEAIYELINEQNQRADVTLEFVSILANQPTGYSMKIPTINIYGNGELVKSAIIWEGFEWILHNDFKVNPENLEQVMVDYKNWMAESINN